MLFARPRGGISKTPTVAIVPTQLSEASKIGAAIELIPRTNSPGDASQP